MILFVLALALAAAFLAAWAIYKRDNSVHDTASTVQAVLTTVAIVLAGYWYFVERKGEPHADVTQQLAVLPIGSDYAVVEAQISIKNLGSTLLKVEAIDIRLQQISPELADNRRLAASELAALSSTDWPALNAAGAPLFNEAELQWPVLRWYKKGITREVEPGETDMVVATFLVSCNIKIVRVAANVGKSNTSGNPEDQRWWKVRSIADITSVCGKRGDEP